MRALAYMGERAVLADAREPLLTDTGCPYPPARAVPTLASARRVPVSSRPATARREVRSMQAQAMERSHLWLELTGIQELPESSLKPALAQERPSAAEHSRDEGTTTSDRSPESIAHCRAVKHDHAERRLRGHVAVGAGPARGLQQPVHGLREPVRAPPQRRDRRAVRVRRTVDWRAALVTPGSAEAVITRSRSFRAQQPAHLPWEGRDGDLGNGGAGFIRLSPSPHEVASSRRRSTVNFVCLRLDV